MTTINPMYTEKEISHQLKDSNAKMIFSYEDGLDVALNSVKNLQRKCQVVSFGKSKPGSIPLFEVYSDLKYQKLAFKNNEESKQEAALLAYSSGTTGLPKGVITTHYNLISNLLQCEFFFDTSIHSGLVSSGILPFFHCYGIMINMLLGMHNFLKTIVIAKLDFEKVFSLQFAFKISVLEPYSDPQGRAAFLSAPCHPSSF